MQKTYSKSCHKIFCGNRKQQHGEMQWQKKLEKKQ